MAPTQNNLFSETAPHQVRADLQAIAEMIEPGSRVLDIGCGDGALLAYLGRIKQVDGRGIELSQQGVNACVSHGLSVIQGDADTDLENYPDAAFDYAILSQTLQATRDPKMVLSEMLRIASHVIVSFPNFGAWWIRLDFLLRGRMPVTRALSHQWYDTPNIHLCTIRDFLLLCGELGVKVEKSVILGRGGKAGSVLSSGCANWLAEQGVFLLTKHPRRA